MALFTVRVDLEYGDWFDYESLHEGMSSAGFCRQITADNGVVYQLPVGEYSIVGEFTNRQVMEMAKWAAKKAGRKACILLSHATSRTWSGLKTVRPAQENAPQGIRKRRASFHRGQMQFDVHETPDGSG